MVESRRSALNEVAKAKLLSTYLGTTEIGPGMLFGVIVDNPQHGPLALQLPLTDGKGLRPARRCSRVGNQRIVLPQNCRIASPEEATLLSVSSNNTRPESTT